MKKDIHYYMSKPYQMLVVKGEEEVYTICFPDLPGCVTTGETPEEAIKNAEDAKKCWFEACLKDKRHIPEPSDLMPLKCPKKTDAAIGNIFLIPDSQTALLEQFKKKHAKCEKGTAGEQYAYHFVPTGIGTAIRVSCSCGCELMLGDFLEDITDYRELEPKPTDTDSFEKAAIAILSMKDEHIRRLSFRSGDFPFESIYSYAAGISHMADERIGECILWKVKQDKNGQWVDVYKGTDEENLSLFLSQFEKNIRKEVKKYDCRNEKLLELVMPKKKGRKRV